MRELDLGGIFLSPMVGYLTFAILLYFLVVRRFLIPLERSVWNPFLFRMAVFVILLTLLILLF